MSQLSQITTVLEAELKRELRQRGIVLIIFWRQVCKILNPS